MPNSLRRIITFIALLAILCVLASGENTQGRVVAQTISDNGNARILVTDTGIEISANLYSSVKGGDEPPFMVYMDEDSDLAAAYDMDWIERGRYVYETLNKRAQTDQRELLGYLTRNKVSYTSYWINNSIYVEGLDASTFDGLLNFAEIASIEPQHIAFVPEPDKANVTIASTAIQPNLLQVDAPEVWAQGIDGNGITVASIDTGVRYTHRTLEDQYRGTLSPGAYDHDYDWFDPTGTSSGVPVDDQGHGTHTVGTMVGGDDNDIIGMATGAEWIACKACVGRNCSEPDLLACAQFTLAPTTTSGLAPNPDLRPQIVNNSWGDGDGTVKQYDDWFQSAVDSWQAAGIYPVFSAGNSRTSLPPECETVGNPARYGNVTAVGATGTTNGAYANYSLRGPGDQPDTVNPLSDPYVKPQVVAPGTDIWSASYNDDLMLRQLDGTSMAVPHVAGLVALMWQAAPCLIGDYATTETLLEQTANPVYSGLPSACPSDPADLYPNNSTGWGEIDADAAVAAAREYCGDATLMGRVTDNQTGLPIAQAAVKATSAKRSIMARTQADGSYVIALWPDTYSLSVSAYGYETASSNLTVSAGITRTLNFGLTPSETHTLSGRVNDAETEWPLYAQVAYSIQGSDGNQHAGSLWTDSVDGTFSLEIPENTVCQLNIAAYATGYRSYSSTFSAPLADTETVYSLYPCAECTAPGASLKASVETFGDQHLPAAWQNIDNTGTGIRWQFDDPANRSNETGGTGAFAIIDSDLAGATSIDAELRTPFYNMSGTSQVTLAFRQAFRHLQSETADVDVSIDGGVTWTNIYRLQGQDALGPDSQEIDISSIAAGQPLVMVRFHYYGAFDEWYWQLDDVHLFSGQSACQRASGGLIVGQIYAVDIDHPLADAVVSNQLGSSTYSSSTADPAVDDGYYLLFCPSGDNIISAAAPYYETSSVSIDVPGESTTAVNLVLSAPRTTITATSYTGVITASQQISWPLRIANQGSAPLEYELLEQDYGISSLGQSVANTTNQIQPLSPDILAAIESHPAAITSSVQSAGEGWETMAPLPEGRTRPVVAAVGQFIYVIGGTNDQQEKTNSVFRYDTQDDSWSLLPPAPTALDGADAAVVAGRIYIPGDADTQDTYVYDTFQGIWTVIPANGGYSARWEYAAVPYNEDVYVLGGLVSGVVSNQVWVLDTINQVWHQSGNMMAARLGSVAGQVNNELVIAGGMTGTASSLNPLLTCEIWDGASWRYGPALPGDGTDITRWSYAADGTGTEGLWIAGGPRDENLGNADNTGLFSATTETWTVTPELPTMNQPRGYLEGAVAADGFFYCIGGQSTDGNTVYTTVERHAAVPLQHESSWLSFSPGIGTVAPGTEAQSMLTLDANQVSEPGTYRATIVVNSNDPLCPQTWIPITMTISAQPGTADLDCPETSNAGGHPGERALHRITIRNTGQSSDYYYVHIGGDTWEAIPPSIVGPVPPEASIEFIVAVQVPATSDWPESDSCTLQIASALHPETTQELTMTTQAYPPRMRLPLIYN